MRTSMPAVLAFTMITTTLAAPLDTRQSSTNSLYITFYGDDPSDQ